MSAGDPAVPPSSLIVCSRNRPRFLLETIHSVLQGGEVPAEIVVVDQSDAPQSGLAALATARACEVRHLPLRSVGLARARNAGIAAARHDLLAFIDDDMWVDAGWYGALLRALLAAGPRGVVTGQVRAAEMEVPGGVAPSLMVGDAPAVYEGRVGRDVLAAGNMAIHRCAFGAVGLFDERLGAGARFPASEDNDFAVRLLDAGYRILYEPAAVLYHRSWRTKGDYARLHWSYGRGQGAFYTKHRLAGDGSMSGRMRWDLLRHLRRLPERLRGRELRLLWSDAAYVVGLFSGAAEWWLTQRRREGAG
ncbi:MAG TPA: glycosyltransferase [Thermoanaerobaculia bacterium]|nr:glycosyltransferase [Thermoanaerobaculia bacterium]